MKFEPFPEIFLDSAERLTVAHISERDHNPSCACSSTAALFWVDGLVRRGAAAYQGVGS